MKKLIFSIVALLCALSMNAQEICGYTAKSEQGTYTDLVGGTIVNTAVADTTKAYDGMCYALDGEGKVLAQKEMTDGAGFPIGFTFNYLGKAFTQFGICANGYVVLGTADQKLTFKANNSWYGSSGIPYAIGLYSNTRFTRVGADQMQISYKSSSTELVVEFKNVLLSSESKLTKEGALDPAKATLWGYQLHILKDGTFYWIVKGLENDTKGGSTSMALTENVGEYVGFTSYSKTDFLTNPVAAANSCSTASTIKAASEGTKVVFIGAPDVITPTKNAAAIKIDDKKSSQDGNYTFRATIEEPEDGDAEGYIMLLSKDAEPDTNPADGIAYVKDDVLGNSKVYVSSSKVYNLYGLEPGVYYVKAFAYNKIGAKGPKYLIDGAPMASVATPKAGTTAPDSLWVRSTASASIGLGVKGNAAGQTIIVAACDSIYNPGNYGVRPYPGNLSATSKKNDLILDENGKQVGKVVYVGVPTPGSGSTFTVSSLKASTPYYFVAYASDGEQLSWDPDFLQVWATTEITVPYSVALDKAPENNQPVGWTSEPGGEYEGFFVSEARVGADNQMIKVLQGTNTRFRDYDWTASLTSPEVTLTKDCKYTFKWRMDEKGMYGMQGVGHGPDSWSDDGEYLKFEVICDGVTTLAKNYTYENAPECLANKEWVNEAIDLSAYSGKKVQVKMTWRCDFAKGVDMFIDSLTFEQYAVAPTKVPSLSFVKKHMSSSFDLKADIVEPSEPDADGYVMLVSKNAAPTMAPVEGVTYNDEDSLGNAVVSIHTNRLMSKNIRPIEEGVTYYVTVYPYNTGNGGPKYLIEGAPLGSVVIPTADLTAPAEFKALDEQKYTDKISFSVKANEANQTVIVAYSDSTCNPGNYGSLAAVGEINPATAKAGDQLYDPSGNPCGKIAYVGPTGEFTVEGLLPSTSYYFTAFSANDKTVSWNPDYINCWAATKGVAPYEVNMAAAPVRDLPAGWSATPEGENRGFFKNSNGLTKNLPPSGNPDVFYSTAPSALDEATHTATLTSPVIALTNGNTLSFDWVTVAWGRFSNTGYGPAAWDEEDMFKVELLDGENVVELKSYNFETAPICLDNQEYVSENFDLSAYAGKDVQFRIVWHSLAASQVYMYIDAFKVSVSPILTAGEYKITATITPAAGVTVPAELEKYVGGYTASGTLDGPANELTIATSEAGFVLNGFKVVNNAVVLDPANTVAFGEKVFNLADSEGNTTGSLAITDNGDNTYTLEDGLIVYMGNVVGSVTGITIVPVKYGELPAIPANAVYSWQSPKGVVEETGGKAVASEADPTRVNYPQAIQGVQYFTISLNGKKDLSDDKYSTVTLDQPLVEGDTIVVYAFKNKDDASKKSGVKFFWGAEGQSSVMACGDDFPNLYEGGEPVAVKYIVPADAAGNTVFRMSCSETGTNLFIAQLYILPYEAATGINEVNAKAVKSGKFLENGKLVIVKNGVKYNVTGVIE